MINLPIPRLDKNPQIRNALLKFCRLKEGDIWNDPLGRHKIGCLDAANKTDIENIMGDKKAVLAIQDPLLHRKPFWMIVIEDSLKEKISSVLSMIQQRNILESKTR